MPNRQDPVIYELEEFDFNPDFATFALDELKQIAGEQSETDLRNRLIAVTNSLGSTINELGFHLENRENEVKETARDELDQLRNRHAAATDKIKSCVASFLSIATLLDELYISENSDIETKDKLYLIRQMLREKKEEMRLLLDVESEGISNQIRSAIRNISNL